MEPLPSRSALVRIGKALAAGTETDAQLDQLDVLLGRCDEIKAGAVDRLLGALASVDLKSGGTLWVRGRTKTLVTLREKLERMGGHQLPVIRDLAGLRIVGDMTLAEQDEVLVIAAAALSIDQDDIKVIDRRTEPIQGYRALHGELVIEGVRVELQVRTLLQHEWAELYERAGDHFGRSIRYSAEETKTGSEDLPAVAERLPAMLRTVSDLIADAEGITFDDADRKFTEARDLTKKLPMRIFRWWWLRRIREMESTAADQKLRLSHARQILRKYLGTLSEELDLLMEKGDS